MKTIKTILILISQMVNCIVMFGQEGENIHQNNNLITNEQFSSFTISFEMNRGHIIIPVEINGKTLNLTLDNGNVSAPVFLYGSPKIDSLFLDYEGDVLVGGAGDGEMPTARIAKNVTIKLSSKNLDDQTIVVMPYDPQLLKAFEGEDGVIGGTIWKNFVVNIDFENDLLTLFDPEDFRYSGDGEEIELGYFADGGSSLNASVKLEDGDEFAGLFHLDLGSPIPLSLNVGTDPAIKIPERTIEREAFGSQGEFVEYVGRINHIKIGEFIIKDVLTSFTNTASLSNMGNEGDIGNGIYQRFNVTFDYMNDRLFLEPNSKFSDPFDFNMSGLQLLKTDNGDFKIAGILPKSPAREVDLIAGDIVVKIDDKAATELNRNELDKLLKREGHTLELTIKRNKESRSVSLRLKRII
jgi:hypothetical protein